MPGRWTNPRGSRVFFITGTDTGAGKTLLTGLLLGYLRSQGVNALAIKPYCSGGREDVRFLSSLQPGALSPAEMNPFYYDEPVAPLLSAQIHRKRVSLARAVKHILRIGRKCDVLLVEGSGGLLVPLDQGYTVRDLVRELECDVIVAARNRLGVINHSLLTLEALKKTGCRSGKLVLMGAKGANLATRTNATLLSQIIGDEVFEIPFLRGGRPGARAVGHYVKKLQKTLAQILS